MVNKLADNESEDDFMDQDSDDQNILGDEEIQSLDDGMAQERHNVYPDSEDE